MDRGLAVVLTAAVEAEGHHDGPGGLVDARLADDGDLRVPARDGWLFELNQILGRAPDGDDWLR